MQEAKYDVFELAFLIFQNLQALSPLILENKELIIRKRFRNILREFMH